MLRNPFGVGCGAVVLAAVVVWAPARGEAVADQVAAAAGKWGDPFPWPNVCIHASLLPTGKVLFWSRREVGQGLDPQDCVPRLWNPAEPDPAKAFRTVAGPRNANGESYNLFCGGHAFLADGRLLAVGGHIADGRGEPHASIYDPANGWAATAPMNAGRWYPTAVTLPDGSVLVSGGADEHANPNEVQQVWANGQWRSIVTFVGLPKYPRLHVAPDGRVFMAGPLKTTQHLDTAGGGAWQVFGDRARAGPGQPANAAENAYAPSVMYAPGKVLYIGGDDPPTTAVDLVDLTAAGPWRATAPMHFARRQHNATILPDGTVLVTGGSQGAGFNNLTPGQPIRAAEVWNPATEMWTVLAEEKVDRCYHSVALLLPDGRVLSAGGGEYRPGDPASVNPAADSHRDAQLYSPPYLFHGPRPVITAAPAAIGHGQTFEVATPDPAGVAGVTLVRLSSVTHSWNMNQRFNRLASKLTDGKLKVTAPAKPAECPPGHYLLFLLNHAGVPSVARTVRVG